MVLKDSRGLVKGIKRVAAGEEIALGSRKRLTWRPLGWHVGRFKEEASW